MVRRKTIGVPANQEPHTSNNTNLISSRGFRAIRLCNCKAVVRTPDRSAVADTSVGRLRTSPYGPLDPEESKGTISRSCRARYSSRWREMLMGEGLRV